MKRIDEPNINNLQLFDNIVANKHGMNKTILQSCRDIIKSRYEYYNKNKYDLEFIKPVSDSVIKKSKDELIGCYSNNINLVQKKRELTEKIAKCPYCLINEVNTFDHYFNKNDYPEFSVYIPNLIPCCSKCNTFKGGKLFDPTGKRSFIHFYYEIIPNTKFLYFRFSCTDSNQFKINIRLDDEFKSKHPVISNHFIELKLFDRYKKIIPEKLSEIIREMNYNKNELGNDFLTFKKTLNSQYLSRKETYGENDWQTCIYEGALNSPNFLEHFW